MGQLARWKWGFLLVAVLAFLSGCYDALAAPATYPDDGPNWSAIAKWAAGALLALVAFYAKSVESRVTKLEEVAQALQRSLDRDYHVKSDIDRRFDRVDGAIEGVHERLDNLRLPRRLRVVDEE